MKRYRMNVLTEALWPTDEQLLHKGEFDAANDDEAILEANKLFAKLAFGEQPHVYVLFEGDRFVAESMPLKGSALGKRSP